MFYLPIFGAILESTGTVLEKSIMKVKKMNFKNYTVYGFLSICLVMLPFLYFFWNIKPEAFLLKNIILFIAVVIISIFANLFTYYSMKREDISEIEPIRLMQPLFTILIAFLLSFFFSAYSKEGNLTFLILSLIASFALILSHVKKNHLAMDKYIIAAILGSFFFASELVISKSILDYYSSFTFYFLRCIFVFFITFAIFRPKLKVIPNKTKGLMLLVGAMWSVQRMILYWGYIQLGVIYTTVVLSILTPVFIYLLARIFLKEKLTWRNILSTIVILICVILAIVLKSN